MDPVTLRSREYRHAESVTPRARSHTSIDGAQLVGHTGMICHADGGVTSRHSSDVGSRRSISRVTLIDFACHADRSTDGAARDPTDERESGAGANQLDRDLPADVKRL